MSCDDWRNIVIVFLILLSLSLGFGLGFGCCFQKCPISSPIEQCEGFHRSTIPSIRPSELKEKITSFSPTSIMCNCSTCTNENPSLHPNVSSNIPITILSSSPANSPTIKSSKYPTGNPTRKPTRNPTRNPTKKPSRKPTRNPTRNPTKSPTYIKNPITGELHIWLWLIPVLTVFGVIIGFTIVHRRYGNKISHESLLALYVALVDFGYLIYTTVAVFDISNNPTAEDIEGWHLMVVFIIYCTYGVMKRFYSYYFPIESKSETENESSVGEKVTATSDIKGCFNIITVDNVMFMSGGANALLLPCSRILNLDHDAEIIWVQVVCSATVVFFIMALIVKYGDVIVKYGDVVVKYIKTHAIECCNSRHSKRKLPLKPQAPL